MRARAIAASLSLALTGCVSMSGYDANTDFACKAPDGVLCESMSGIYANAQANNLPGQRVTHGEKEKSKDEEVSQAKVEGGVLTKPLFSGTPIRSAPRILRVWFAPWEDSDGDLHDQSFVYLPIDSGRWLVEHNRRRIQDKYRPVRPPANTPIQLSSVSPRMAGVTPSGQGAQRPGAQRPGQGAGSADPADGEPEVIGVRQDAMSPEQAASFLKGVLGPNGPVAAE